MGDNTCKPMGGILCVVRRLTPSSPFCITGHILNDMINPLTGGPDYILFFSFSISTFNNSFGAC